MTAPEIHAPGLSHKEGNMKRITIIVLSAVTFLLALGLTIYPVVSIYVNQKYASEIYFTYEEAVEQTDDMTLAQARLDALRYNESIVPGTLTENEAFSQEALEQAAGEYDRLLNIRDNYPKYVLRTDDFVCGNFEGIKTMRVADFLLSDEY